MKSERLKHHFKNSQRRREILKKNKTSAHLLSVNYTKLFVSPAFKIVEKTQNTADVFLKHFDSFASWNKNRISAITSSVKAIHPGENRETQEPAHISQESALQISSPGVIAEILTSEFSLFCACWVHIKNYEVRIQMSLRTVIETSFMLSPL